MRYLDLEHEFGHIEQLQQLAKQTPTKEMPPTEVMIQRPNGTLKVAKEEDLIKGRISGSQNVILEYHNRLIEFLRLYDRGASNEILNEHINGIETWENLYQSKGIRKGFDKDNMKWVEEYFPDMEQIKKQYREVIRTMKNK